MFPNWFVRLPAMRRTASQLAHRRAKQNPRALRFEELEGREVPATISVTSTLDDGSSGTLRAAIAQANSTLEADLIDLNGLNGTITLIGGQLEVTSDMTVSGPGANLLAVSANSHSFVLRVNRGVTASISGLTIADGVAFAGGGIENAGTLSIDGCRFAGNRAPSGGAIINAGTLAILNSTFTGNEASPFGGAALWNFAGSATIINSNFSGNLGGSLRNSSGGRLTVIDSDFTGNRGTSLTVINFFGDTETIRVGSGIYNTLGATANVFGCTFSDNAGSAVFNYHAGASPSTVTTLTVADSTFSNNEAEYGGGLFNFDSGASAVVDRSTFAHNSASGMPFSSGGGLNCFDGTLVLSNSTFSDNQAGYNQTGQLVGGGYGGGLTVGEIASVVNCTFSGNRAYNFGGGIFEFTADRLAVANSTFSGNIAVTGGGGGLSAGGGPAPMIGNTIVFSNTGPQGSDVFGGFSSQGYNLIGNAGGSSGFGSRDLMGLNPLLAPLGNYGGPTQTMPLLPGSRAIDAGSVALAVDAAGNPLTTDQRGKPRVVSGLIDIGACERQPVTVMIGGYDGVYDGQPHGLTGTATGDLGENLTIFLDLGPAHLDAGTYAVIWNCSAPGYSPEQGQAEVVIRKAIPTVTTVGGSFIYDGQPHSAAGTVTGVGGANLGSPQFTYYYRDGAGNWVPTGNGGNDIPVAAGYYMAVGSFAGNANYEPASAAAYITISYRWHVELSGAFKAGRGPIQIKIQLTDAAGNNVSRREIELTALRLERINADGTRTQVTLQSMGGSNPENRFRYDETLGGYIFNLDTRGLEAGTYEFFWSAEGDPVEHSVRFLLV